MKINYDLAMENQLQEIKKVKISLDFYFIHVVLHVVLQF